MLIEVAEDRLDQEWSAGRVGRMGGHNGDSSPGVLPFLLPELQSRSPLQSTVLVIAGESNGKRPEWPRWKPGGRALPLGGWLTGGATGATTVRPVNGWQWTGLALELVGLACAAVGFRQTWYEYARGEPFLEPMLRPVTSRVRAVQNRLRKLLRR
jgi:hypothetical protein